MPSAITNTISLLGGAAVGAVAMYLLDPDNGADRRDDIGGTASDAVSATSSAVRSTVGGASGSAKSAAATARGYAADRLDDATDAAKGGAAAVSSSASTIAAKVSKYAADLVGKMGGHAHDAANAVSDAHDQTRERVSDAVDSAKSYGRKLIKRGKAKKADLFGAADDAADSAKSKLSGLVMRDKDTDADWLDASDTPVSYAAQLAAHARVQKQALSEKASALAGHGRSVARRALGRPEPHPVATATGVTAGSVTVLAIGAGLMYYMDPERGRTRRALLRDKAYSIYKQSGNKVRGYGHHLGNKAEGYKAQAKAAVPADWVDKAKSAVGANGDGHK